MASTTAREEPLGPLREASQPHGVTLNLAVKLEPARVLSATTIMAENQGAIRRAEVPASAEPAEALAEAMAAGTVNRRVFLLLNFVRFRNEEM